MSARKLPFSRAEILAALALNDAQATPAAFDATVLPASSATRRSEILRMPIERPVLDQHMLGLDVRYLGAASGTTGAAELRVWYSCKEAEPADYTDASWRLVAATDGVITAAQNYAGATPAVMGKILMQPIKLTTPAAAAAVAMPTGWTIKLPPCRWLYVEACEIGDAAHPGTLTIGLTLG